MARFWIATLIGSTSLEGAEREGSDMLETLRGARPDLFGTDNPVVDFHLDRYVILHSADIRSDAEAWARDRNVRLHGAILSRGDIYQLYVGWTGLIDSRLGEMAA